MADSLGTRGSVEDDKAIKMARAPQVARPSDGVPNLVRYEVEEQKKETTKLERLSEKVEEPLISVSAMFPLDLVPDQVIIELHKVTIIHRDLFLIEDIITIPTVDIEETAYSSTILSATLRIKPMGKDEIKVSHLPRSEAAEARKILDGIVECNKANIDLTKISGDALKQHIDRLGKVAPSV